MNNYTNGYGSLEITTQFFCSLGAKQYLNLFRRHAVAQRHHHSRQLVGRDEPVVVLRSGKINGLRQAQC